MILSFKNKLAEALFKGESTKETRKFPQELHQRAIRKLDMLDSVEKLSDLLIPPANQLEALSGDRKGQHSIRINEQWRICFEWQKDGPQNIEIVDYH